MEQEVIDPTGRLGDHRYVAETFCEYLNDSFMGRDLAATEVVVDRTYVPPIDPERLGLNDVMTHAQMDVLRLQIPYDSWDGPRITGYEVKVNRSDFLSDVRSGKWEKYLAWCNGLYFVFPAGFSVAKDEIPKGVGGIFWDPHARRRVIFKKCLPKSLPPGADKKTVEKFLLPLLWQMVNKLKRADNPTKEERRLRALRDAMKLILLKQRPEDHKKGIEALYGRYWQQEQDLKILCGFMRRALFALASERGVKADLPGEKADLHELSHELRRAFFNISEAEPTRQRQLAGV